MIEGPYKLPKGWRWVRLGEVFKLKNGKFIRTTDLQAEGNIPVYGSNGLLGFTSNPLLREGRTIVIGRVGACGAINVVDAPCWISDNAMFVANWFIECDIEYVALALRNIDFSFFIKKGAQPSISQELIYNIFIPLPPLDEQKQIVARIEELMDRIKEAKKLRQETKKQTELLWQSVLAETFPQPGTQLPNGWRWVRLGEVCSKPQYGLTQSASTTPVGPKFLRITDITSGYIDWEKVPYCRISQHELDKYKLDEGDLLFARSGSIGATILIKEKPPYDAVFASYLIRVRLNKFLVYPEFLYWFTRSPSGQEQLIPRGATQKNINAKFIQSLLIPLPPLEEQKRIANYLQEVHEKIQELKEVQAKTGEEIKLLEQSILEKAFRGEL